MYRKEGLCGPLFFVEGHSFKQEGLYRSGLKFEIFQMKELSPPLRKYRVQKFRHAFCHRATFSRYCVKAELTFEPYIFLMEG